MHPNRIKRSLYSCLRLLFIVSLLIAFKTESALAQCSPTLSVTNSADSGIGSLRQAISILCAAGTITFDAGLAGQTIVLSSELLVDKDLTIDGSSLATPVILSGNNATRIMMINSGVDVMFATLSFIDGRAVEDHGGAIYNQGNLTINAGLFQNNVADYYGGAIAHFGTGTTLTVSNSTFINNQTNPTLTYDGGAILAWANTTLNVDHSTFTNNSSARGGGAISSYGASSSNVITYIRHSTFSGNSALSRGGAIQNDLGIMTIENSTFSNNSTQVRNNLAGTVVSFSGFGTSLGSEILTISNSTFTDNTDGIANGDNSTLHLSNTIITNSTVGEDCTMSGNGIIATNTNNFIEDNTCNPLLSGDPKLGPLQDNGGATHTHALLPGSPAIDAGDNGACLATDQRGIARPFDGDGNGTATCDIGAYEVDEVVSVIAVNLPDDATGAPNSQVTIPVQVPNAVDGLDIIAYSFQLNFDPSVLSLPANAADAYDTTGTLSDGWTITANTGTPGEVRLAGFNIAPLSGSGTLINLTFDVVGPANSYTALTWSDFLFNEGVPGVQTTDGFFTVLSYSLGGQVFYQDRANRAMSGVTIDLSGATTEQATTDGAGYSFTIEATGAHTVTPAYSGPVNGISAFDAAYIAQCVAGLRDSADCPLLAADTSGNSSLSAFDAALIAQYAAGLAGPTSRVGTWVFDPVSRSYAAIEGDLPAEDFGAYLVGEVTGNWSAPVAAVAAGKATIAAQRVVPVAVAPATDQRAVTLQLAHSRDDLLAFEITLRYDATAGRLVESVPAAVGWDLVANEVEPGVVKLVGYGITPAAGDLVTLRFQSTSNTTERIAPVVTTVQLNEESPWQRAATGDTEEVLSWKEYLPLIVK